MNSKVSWMLEDIKTGQHEDIFFSFKTQLGTYCIYLVTQKLQKFYSANFLNVSPVPIPESESVRGILNICKKQSKKQVCNNLWAFLVAVSGSIKFIKHQKTNGKNWNNKITTIKKNTEHLFTHTATAVNVTRTYVYVYISHSWVNRFLLDFQY